MDFYYIIIFSWKYVFLFNSEQQLLIKVVCPICPVYNNISLLIWSCWVTLDNLFEDFCPSISSDTSHSLSFSPVFDGYTTRKHAHLTLISFYPISGIDKSPRGHYWSIVVVITRPRSRLLRPSVSGSERMWRNPTWGSSKRRGLSISAPAPFITATYANGRLYLREPPDTRGSVSNLVFA